MTDPVASCPAHPGANAVEVCVRCGRFVCADCEVEVLGRRPFCPECADRDLEASPRSRWAVALACLTLVGLVPGIIALLLVELELRSIARGAARGGEPWARMARKIVLVQVGAAMLLASLQFI